MSDETEQPAWAANTGLSEETSRVFTYPPTTVKEEWEDEAEANGFSSLSKYVFHLVEEARAYRRDDNVDSRQHEQQRIQELQSEIEQLRDELEQQRQQQSARPEIDDADFLEQFLDDQYKSLEEILQDIVESGVLNDLLRQRVEDQLYYMASRDQVEYRRGWGWKTADNGGDQ